MRNTILMTLLAVFQVVSASAQFHTVTKGEETAPLFTMEQPLLAQKQPEKAEIGDKSPVLNQKAEKPMKDASEEGTKHERMDNARNDKKKKSSESNYEHRNTVPPLERSNLPELTIPNLYEEIQRHGILFPKIVLAQAILETGWFRSHACRTKNNLFGLTNPRTGKYFEFDHWTESVRAYYTKVQYRYKGGNYLLWLRKIGYAEDQGYIRAVIKVLRML